MSTRISQEARIRRYFSNSPLGEATVMLNLVKDIIVERGFGITPLVSKPKRIYRKRKQQETVVSEQ